MKKVTEHQTLLERSPVVSDVQSARLLLLFCAATRANYWLRAVRPDLTLQFATAHDHDVLVCLGRILEVPVGSFASDETVSLPLSKGGLGLRSAVRSRVAAHWASWADCLPTVQKRHPQVASIMLQGLNGGRRQTISLNVARECATSLAEAGCELPTWLDLVDGVRPPIPMDMGDPFQPRQGWQHFVSNTVEERHLRETLPCLLQNALSFGLRVDPSLRGHSCVARPCGSRSSSPSHSAYCSFVASTCPSPCLPAAAGVAVHSTALATTGQLARLQGWRGFAVEKICREGGARVSTNTFVRDLDLAAFNHFDGRRLEVVADGLSLFGGAQLAIETTLVSALRRHGTATRGAANRNGVAIQAAHRRKERTYPELVGEEGRARLVTLAGEDGGR